MKKFSPALFSLVAFLVAVSFSACSKINEGTEVGGDLIPAVDNVNTFEKIFLAETDNLLFADSTRITSSDDVALGHIGSDPEFGTTHGDLYFDVSRNAPRTYPFVNYQHRQDSVVIDSVILSLGYKGAYGDTTSSLTVRVYEIAQNAGFNDTTLFHFTGPGFETTGGELGSKTFAINTLNDSVTLIRKRDTSRVGNVLRIPLSNSLGERFKNFDTTNTAKGGFYSDSLFHTLFKGFAVQADQSGSGLAYFSLSDQTNTKLTIYFRATLNGKIDTSAAEFVHNVQRYGRANIIKRTPAGNYQANVTNGDVNDERLYIQSIPMGSFANIRIPQLDTFSNQVVHRAELIVTRIPSAMDQVFTHPTRLILDKFRTNGTGKDTAYLLQDMTINASNQPDFTTFGGVLRSDNTYRFNITRHVQGIITRKEENFPLRLYAPLDVLLYSVQNRSFHLIPGTEQVGRGRVVLAGGNHPDPALRLRLRIIYSKI